MLKILKIFRKWLKKKEEEEKEKMASSRADGFAASKNRLKKLLNGCIFWGTFEVVSHFQSFWSLANNNCNNVSDERVALHYVAQDVRKVSHLRYLASKPQLMVNLKDRHLYTPLHYAVANRNIEGVEILLNRSDVDVNSKRKGGITPLHDAVHRGEKN